MKLYKITYTGVNLADNNDRNGVAFVFANGPEHAVEVMKYNEKFGGLIVGFCNYRIERVHSEAGIIYADNSL